MFFNRLAEGAEDDAVLGQLLFVGSGNRNAVEDGVNRHIREALLLTQGNPELVEGLEQFGVHLIEAGLLLLLFGSGVINDVLVVDGRVTQSSPIGLSHALPLAEGTQAEIQQELRLLLFGRDQPNNLFTEALGDLLRFNVSDKAIAIRLANQVADIAGGHWRVQSIHRRSGTHPEVWAWISSRVMLCFSPRNGLSSVRKSMQWQSLRSRIGTQGQFQNAWETSASLSS